MGAARSRELSSSVLQAGGRLRLSDTLVSLSVIVGLIAVHVLALERVVNGTLDRIVEITIPAYLEVQEQTSS